VFSIPIYKPLLLLHHTLIYKAAITANTPATNTPPMLAMLLIAPPVEEDPDAEGVEEPEPEPVFDAVDPELVAVIFPVETVLLELELDPEDAVEVVKVDVPVAVPEAEEDAEVELLATIPEQLKS